MLQYPPLAANNSAFSVLPSSVLCMNEHRRAVPIAIIDQFSSSELSTHIGRLTNLAAIKVAKRMSQRSGAPPESSTEFLVRQNKHRNVYRMIEATRLFGVIQRVFPRFT
jgi:hypothetical protein